MKVTKAQRDQIIKLADDYRRGWIKAQRMAEAVELLLEIVIDNMELEAKDDDKPVSR